MTEIPQSALLAMSASKQINTQYFCVLLAVCLSFPALRYCQTHHLCSSRAALREPLASILAAF